MIDITKRDRQTLIPGGGCQGLAAFVEKDAPGPRDRLEIARRFAQEWGQVVVLKGANTVVAGPDGRVAVTGIATTALAHAGTGDVLAGIITGLRAQGLSAFDAAVVGSWIHARAGIAAAEWVGHPASVLASDVLDSIADVLQQIDQ